MFNKRVKWTLNKKLLHGNRKSSMMIKNTETQMFWDVVERFIKQRKDQRKMRYIIRKWSRHLGAEHKRSGAHKWRQADYVTAADYVAGLRKTMSSNSVRCHISTLSKLYRTLRDCGECKHNPFSEIRMEPQDARRVRYYRHIPQHEILALLSVIHDDTLVGARDRATVAAMVGQGLRVMEALGSKLSDFDGLKLKLRETKKGKDEIIECAGWVCEEVNKWVRVRGREKGYLFPSILHPGRRRHMRFNKMQSLAGFNQRLRKYAGDAGIESFSSHSFRVASITTALESGHCLESVRDFARHSTVTVTERYDRRKHKQLKLDNLFTKHVQK